MNEKNLNDKHINDLCIDINNLNLNRIITLDEYYYITKPTYNNITYTSDEQLKILQKQFPNAKHVNNYFK